MWFVVCVCVAVALFFFFFFGFVLFTGPVPSPPEGEDAIVARISGKFRETPRLKKQSLSLLFYNSQRGVDIKEKKKDKQDTSSNSHSKKGILEGDIRFRRRSSCPPVCFLL